VNDTIRLGRIAGISIGVNWSVLAIAWLISWSLSGRLLPGQVPGLSELAYWLVGVGVAVLFFASLLGHELAHAVVARRNGLEVEGITLWLLGGVAKLRGEARTPGAEARIAIVGPLASLAVAGVSWLVATGLDSLALTDAALLIVVAAQWLTVVNIVLAVFNLLPGAPLDGGRVARAVVWAIQGDRLTATRVASLLGRLLGYGLALFGVVEIVVGTDLGGLWSIVLGFFLAGAAGVERRQAEILDALDGVPVAAVMMADPPVAPGSLTIDAFIDHALPGTRTSTWLITGPDGTAVGVLGLERLSKLGQHAERELRLADLATPITELARTTPDEPLVDLLERVDLEETGARAVVVRDGRVVGLVLPEDIARAIEVGRLGPRAGRGAGRPTGSAARDQAPR
jgi:Zn-dependent protease